MGGSKDKILPIFPVYLLWYFYLFHQFYTYVSIGQTGHGRNAQNVPHQRADNRAQTHVRIGNERTDDICEHFGCCCGGGHKYGRSNILENEKKKFIFIFISKGFPFLWCSSKLIRRAMYARNLHVFRRCEDYALASSSARTRSYEINLFAQRRK